jgi:hypothetical protein
VPRRAGRMRPPLGSGISGRRGGEAAVLPSRVNKEKRGGWGFDGRRWRRWRERKRRRRRERGRRGGREERRQDPREVAVEWP